MLDTTALTPPQPAPSWTHTPDEVPKLLSELIQKDRKHKDRIAALKESECNFESNLRTRRTENLAAIQLALAQAETKFSHVVQPLELYTDVSPSKELRNTAAAVVAAARDYRVESSMRIDICRAKQAAAGNIEASGMKLTPEERRLKNKRPELAALQKELASARLEFRRNLNEEKSSVIFTAEELIGVPQDERDNFQEREDGGVLHYEVSYRSPSFESIYAYARDPETRRRAREGAGMRLSVNVPVLDRIFDLRRKIAALLGYPTWADYAMEERMAKNSKHVIDFLADLERKLRPTVLEEVGTLLEMKRQEHEERGLPFDGHFYASDHSYYRRKYVREILAIDATLVKEHFTVDVVVPTVLKIYQDLLGVTFIEIRGTVWHSDVQQYAVWDNGAKDESGFVGYCYLDLLARESKYPNIAVSCPYPGYIRADGSRNYPVAVIMASFAKPALGKPALMRHHDVVLFFHEMGHVFHTLLSRTQFSRFHGTAGPVDFAEAPSQMLENWRWEPIVLEKLSSHYETKKPAPRELIDKLVKTRYVTTSLRYMEQLFFSAYDLKVHMLEEGTDHTKLWNDLRESMTYIKNDCPTPGQASFSHLASSGGYDAGYYSYTWSLVFATDTYATAFQADPLNSKQGKLYREKILLPGASRDEMEILEDFLGRPPNSEAFMKLVFGDSSETSR